MVIDFLQLYALGADKKPSLLMTQPVSSAMQMNFDKKTRSLVWIVTREGSVYCWRFDFFDETEERNFKIHFSIALMEVSRQEKFAKAVTVIIRPYHRRGCLPSFYITKCIV
jgi:hypothetical protein